MISNVVIYNDKVSMMEVMYKSSLPGNNKLCNYAHHYTKCMWKTTENYVYSVYSGK